MRKTGFLILLLACLCGTHGSAPAQVTAAYFNCVTGCTPAANALVNYSGSATLAIVAGYHTPGDSGSGQYVSGTACPDATSPMPSGTFAAGSNKIDLVSNDPGVVVGSIVNAPGFAPPGTEIAALAPQQIFMTEAAIQSTPVNQSTSFTITGPNGGTIIRTTGGSPICFYKTDYRGDPHEFGAYGDGVPTVVPPTGHDDSPALLNWLGAYGMVTNPASSVAPSNFGPWIATIPANYYVSQPLFCPRNAVLQGFANDTIGTSNSQGAGSPMVTIFAGKAFTVSGAAVMTMGPYCRISGLAIDAHGMNSQGGTLLDAIDIAGTHAVIDSHSLLENGYYGVLCPQAGLSQNLDGLQIKDTEVYNSQDAGILINSGCENDRLNGDIVDQSGGDGVGAGVSFASSDVTIADGIIEGSGGPDLQFSNARFAVVSGMVFAGGGKLETGAFATSIEIDSSTDISICGNRVQGGGNDIATVNSDVRFSGILDNITLCGNVYTARTGGGDANYFPSSIYDVNSTLLPNFTNLHIYETPAQPAVSIFSAAAQALLQPLQIPQFTNNQLSGFTLSNDTNNVQWVDVAPGSAADSTNSTIVALSSPCTVKLNQNGANGLDTGSVARNTTYYIFAIAAAGGGSSTPSCMASTSLAPTFSASYFTVGGGYLVAATGGTFLNGATVYNINPLAGVMVGDAVVSDRYSAIPPGTTINAFTANSQPSPQPTGTWTATHTMTIGVSSTTGIQLGMAILDTSNAGCIPDNIYVSSITPPNSITISDNTSCAKPHGTTLSISGARQLVLSNNATATKAQDTLDIGTGYYRLLGAIYTDNSATPKVVPFTQDGDTFYLATSVEDMSSSACSVSGGASPTYCQLSVPCGRNASCAQAMRVEAFGRIVGGSMPSNQVLLTSVDQSDQTPSTFNAGAPGYTSQSADANATTSATFKVYTSLPNGTLNIPAGAVRVHTLASSPSVYEVTDGWVFHRAQ